MTAARREAVLEQGETPCPLTMHHCPACGHVTLVPRGVAEVSCEGCGEVVSSGYALDLIVADMQAEGSLRLLTSYEQEEQRRDYARLDAEIMLLMNQLPLEIALERRGQREER